MCVKKKKILYEIIIFHNDISFKVLEHKYLPLDGYSTINEQDFFLVPFILLNKKIII